MVQSGLFREDLLYRINTIHIELPPLRERGRDIVLLAEFFLKKYVNKYCKPNLKINHQAAERLLNYPWPGNIRELQHTIEKAVILCDSDSNTLNFYGLSHSKGAIIPFYPDLHFNNNFCDGQPDILS